MNQLPQSIPLGPFTIFSKILEIFASQGAPLVSTTAEALLPPVLTTPAANFPPVSTTLAANFAISFASGVYTGGKFAYTVDGTAANLPPVSGAWGKLIHEKNQKSRIS
jgi:hypothetical protein